MADVLIWQGSDAEAYNSGFPVWLIFMKVCILPPYRISENRSLAIWVNMEDHLKLVSSRSDANIQEAFASICINLVKVRLG